MRKSIPIATIVLMLGAPGAMAQNKSGTSAPAATTKSGVVPDAPIGHRQPRASDVPSSSENKSVESAEDKALDRKIRSICRGC